VKNIIVSLAIFDEIIPKMSLEIVFKKRLNLM